MALIPDRDSPLRPPRFHLETARPLGTIRGAFLERHIAREVSRGQLVAD